MKRVPLIVLVFLASSSSYRAQKNLVPNPSFESSLAPSGYGQIALAPPWNSPTEASADLFFLFATNPNVAVPLNYFGNQLPKHGEKYAGVGAYWMTYESRSYLEVPLTSPLEAGSTYSVRFWISRAELSGFSVDRIGAHFHVGPVGPVPGIQALQLVPQVETPAGVFLTNTGAWQLVAGKFTAVGGEDHLLIGNFRADSETMVLQEDPLPSKFAYYYVDSVRVRKIHELVPNPGFDVAPAPVFLFPFIPL